MKQNVVIIGGGAAGFFTAIHVACCNPDLAVTILEQSSTLLGKVKISGGGRCNVTHACFDVKELTSYYPRGQKELLGPFHQFSCKNTIEWFENRGVKLKTESDGRIFPITDNSQTIIDCLVNEAKQLGITIIKNAKATSIVKSDDKFSITVNEKIITAKKIVIATGSSSYIWDELRKTGHTIISPVPSLFTFNINHPLIEGLSGITFKNCLCKLTDTNCYTSGAVLITHSGLSGPAILKLSAFGARTMFEKNYLFNIQINWVSKTKNDIIKTLVEQKSLQSKKQIENLLVFDLPNRFWLNVLKINSIQSHKKVADLSSNEIQKIADTLSESLLKVYSKNTNKEEFVTAGGIDLKEVDFKTMESKLIPNLYFAGEVLNIDAVTGGFNFQAAWTTGYIAGKYIAQSC